MSKGTEQDQSGKAGGATPGAGASADPVWPVWGGASSDVPAQHPEPTVPADDQEPGAEADAGPLDESSDDGAPAADAGSTSEPEPAPEGADEHGTDEAASVADDDVAAEPEVASEEDAQGSAPDDAADDARPETLESDGEEPESGEPATDEVGTAAAEADDAPLPRLRLTPRLRPAGRALT